MDDQELAALIAAFALAALHLFAGKLRLVDIVPRKRWLSAAGGVSVAYVFVHLLPEIAEGQAVIEERGALTFLEHHVFLVALLGLAVFYGVEERSLRSRRQRRESGEEDRTTDGTFWLSIGSFAAYNAVIGYLLLREELAEVTELVLFTVALGVHFVVNDVGLREHHRHVYDRLGRWVLGAAVLAGWAVGVTTAISEQAIALVIAFLGGGVVLNVLKEELPGQRRARFGPFALGALAYTVLLQIA